MNNIYNLKREPATTLEYIQMIKTGPDNRENVKKSLEKKIKDILNKIEFDNLNKTSVRPIGYGKKSKKRKKSKSRTNKRISKKSNKKKMRGGSQSFGEYLQQPMVIIMILFSIFVFRGRALFWIIIYLMIGFGLYDIKVMTDIRNRRNLRIEDEQQNLEGTRRQPNHWADTFPGVVNRAMVMDRSYNSSTETIPVLK